MPAAFQVCAVGQSGPVRSDRVHCASVFGWNVSTHSKWVSVCARATRARCAGIAKAVSGEMHFSQMDADAASQTRRNDTTDCLTLCMDICVAPSRAAHPTHSARARIHIIIEHAFALAAQRACTRTHTISNFWTGANARFPKLLLLIFHAFAAATATTTAATASPPVPPNRSHASRCIRMRSR